MGCINGDVPNAQEEVKHLSLSPTARRVIYLMQQFPIMWTRVYMDNIFNSQNLHTDVYAIKCLCQGVCRTWGPGVPDQIVQWLHCL
jgi:hypothetical protein